MKNFCFIVLVASIAFENDDKNINEVHYKKSIFIVVK